MKTKQIKTIVIFSFLTTVCFSCQPDKGGKKYDNPYLQYVFGLGIMDASGNDLVKGIEFELENGVVPDEEQPYQGVIKPDLYTYEIIYPDLCMDTYYQHYHMTEGIPGDIGQPEIILYTWDGRFYLLFDLQTGTTHGCPPAETLTFKVSCPYIFGNDDVYEIVTYWSQDSKYHPDYKDHSKEWFDDRPMTICYRVVFNGKEITSPITCASYFNTYISSTVLNNN